MTAEALVTGEIGLDSAGESTAGSTGGSTTAGSVVDVDPAAARWVHERRLIVLAAAVVVIAAVWVSRQGLMFLYADARSHLTISRRVIDGPNRGVVQLGTVWLPLPHLLMTPLTAVQSWWHSGWAVIPVNVVCFAVEAVCVHRLLARRFGARVAWVGVALLLVNPSLLYVHTTAMTEPVLLAAVLLTIAALDHWSQLTKAYSGGEMAVFCGLPATAAVLARYDGWMLAALGGVAVWWVAYRRWSDMRYAFKMARCFVLFPAIAVVWWCWFNWVNFGDPLEFQRGRYSAQVQQKLLEAQGLLPDKGNLVRSIGTFGHAITRSVGWVMLVLAIAGVVVWGTRLVRARGTRTSSVVADVWPVLLLLVPAVFYIASLYLGQIALRPAAEDGASLFNLRYGLAVLPGMVVFGGYAVDAALRRARVVAAPALLAVLLCTVTVGELAGLHGWRSVAVIREGLDQRASGQHQYDAGVWLQQHATSGRILIDDSINPLLPVIDADLDRVIAPFSRDWDAVLADLRLADWLYVDTQNPYDAVAEALRTSTTVGDDFEVAFAQVGVVVYHRRGGSA